MGNQDGNVFHAFLLRSPYQHGVGGGGGFETDGEETTRTSPPCDLMVNRSPSDPGTRSMSPNEQKITSGRLAMSWALSIISRGVTQTGQPGPCTSSISCGSR